MNSSKGVSKKPKTMMKKKVSPKSKGKTVQKGTKMPAKKKSTKNNNTKAKVMKGGKETEGATGLPQQFYNPNKPLMAYPPNSGSGVKTAYGPSNPLDVGVGMLAPFTASKSPTANKASMNQTGGNKKPQNKMKKVSPKKNKKPIEKKGKKMPLKKKTKKTSNDIKAEMMKGGKETEGATGLPAQFYDPKKPLTSYPKDSGFNVPTAYGPSNPLDVGVGLLAPFTSSTSPTANLASSVKTGGKKISKSSPKVMHKKSKSKKPKTETKGKKQTLSKTKKPKNMKLGKKNPTNIKAKKAKKNPVLKQKK